jgi:hypothetical protein
VILRHKYTALVGFNFDQPIDKLRIERGRWHNFSAKKKLVSGGIFSIGNHFSMENASCGDLARAG